MKKPAILILSLALFSCSSQNTGATTSSTSNSKSSANSSSGEYGYAKENAIKVGGFANGPRNEQNYLNSLSGPNGEQIWFRRSGSCCHFETKNSPYGMGMLDIYRVTYQDRKDTVTLYINMYDKEKLKAPEGFKFK